MNRAEIRNECEARIQDPDNALASDDQINRWINQAVKEIARVMNWPVLRVRTQLDLLLGDSTVELPADCRAVLKVTLDRGAGTAGEPLAPVPDRWMQHNMDTATAASGAPQAYTNGGYSQGSVTAPPVPILRVWPVSDSNYSLNVTYARRGTALTADGHYPPFPEEFDEAIILWVMRQYYRQVETAEEVAMHDRAYKDEIQSLIVSYGQENEERYPRIMADWDNFEAISDPLGG